MPRVRQVKSWMSASHRYPPTFVEVIFPSFLSDGAAVAAPSCRSPTISPLRSVLGVSVAELGEVMTILEMHRQGLSVSAIAARLGMDRKTVRKYTRNGVQPSAPGQTAIRPVAGRHR